jgi:WD40 repeat protein
MTRRNSVWRRGAATVAALALLAFSIVWPSRAAGLDPTQMSSNAIKALEQRLTDAGCYSDAIDGQQSPALDDAIKACPDQRPFLRIETGMHTASIRRISVDAACRLLATASDDKTVRLWSLPDGKLDRVIRLPIGAGSSGRTNATALSPDGHWLAIGGWDAAYEKTGSIAVTLVNLSDGAVKRVGAFEQVIQTMSFSADGQRIAIGLGGNNGLRVLERATGNELLADRDYGSDIYGLTFARDGGLVTTSLDGQIRRYGPELKLVAKHPAPDGKWPYGVAIDPTGRHIAVGYYDQGAVSILDMQSLTPVSKAQTLDVGTGNLMNVAWSKDGETLVAGGYAYKAFAKGELRRFLRRFDALGRRKGGDVPATSNTITEVQSCGDGFAFAAGDPTIGLLPGKDDPIVLQVAHTVDARNKVGPAFAVSPDGTSVRFGLGVGDDRPVVFNLAAASLIDSRSLPASFLTARVSGLPVTDWRESDAPKIDGIRLALENREKSYALAIRPDGSGLVLGGDWYVHAYDQKGNPLWSHTSAESAWGVNFAAGGEIITVACLDGTIRWLRWTDGEELLTLFVEPQSRRWVAWTPSGYYMASAGGEDLIGWHVNRGWSQEADFFPASQFRAEYNRPDIVRLADSR